jgi:hypothetical protein
MLYRDIVRHFSGEATYPVTKEDARNTLNLLHTFYVAAEKNQKINPADALESEQLGKTDDSLADLYRTKKDI